MALIAVGVDGSEGAARALRWAADEARLRGARLRAVHAWSVPTVAYADGAGAAYTTWEEDLGKAATAALDRWLAAAGDALEGVEVERRVSEGPAALVLTDAAADADVLVVGSRGLGGFRELLLGSVSHQCAQRSHCPVVIVRG